MKKIYNSPTIETAELRLHTAIMSGVGVNPIPNTDPGEDTPDHAPRRRVF